MPSSSGLLFPSEEIFDFEISHLSWLDMLRTDSLIKILEAFLYEPWSIRKERFRDNEVILKDLYPHNRDSHQVLHCILIRAHILKYLDKRNLKTSYWKIVMGYYILICQYTLSFELPWNNGQQAITYCFQHFFDLHLIPAISQPIGYAEPVSRPAKLWASCLVDFARSGHSLPCGATYEIQWQRNRDCRTDLTVFKTLVSVCLGTSNIWLQIQT
jgi:hypothetical protein